MLRKYGCNICGEGGEYETLTLDCPMFRQASIVLKAWQPLLHSEDSVARVGVLHPTHFDVKAKGASGAAVTIEMGDVMDVASEGTAPEVHLSSAYPRRSTLPPIDKFTYNMLAHGDAEAVGDGDKRSKGVTEPMPCNSSSVDVKQHWADELGAVYATVTQPAVATGDAVRVALLSIASGTTCEPEQVSAAALNVHQSHGNGHWLAELEHRGLSWRSALFVHLYLADMTHFTAANAGYATALPPVNPPARACVQLPLPEGVCAAVEVLVACGPAAPSARILHVQSISQWAPACIGPYSQVWLWSVLLRAAGRAKSHLADAVAGGAQMII